MLVYEETAIDRHRRLSHIIEKRRHFVYVRALIVRKILRSKDAKRKTEETPYASVNSTCAHPPPRVTPGHLFRFSVPGAGHLCTLGATPREFDTRGLKKKPSKARAVKDACLIPSRWRLLWEKIIWFHVIVASPRKTRQAC